MTKTEFVPAMPRICSRCALGSAELWRVGCPRCGGVVVANTDRGQFFRILERAKRDGWAKDSAIRSTTKASAYQSSHPVTHAPLPAFPQQALEEDAPHA